MDQLSEFIWSVNQELYSHLGLDRADQVHAAVQKGRFRLLDDDQIEIAPFVDFAGA